MVSGQAAAKCNEDVTDLAPLAAPPVWATAMASWQLRGGPKIEKPGLFLEVDNFAILGGRNACCKS